jgi:lipoprotein-releasing system permease protein
VATTALGVGVCVALAIAVLSMIGGVRAALTGRLLDAGAHLTVKAGDARGRRSDLLLEIGHARGAVDLGLTAARAARSRLRNVMTVMRTMERTLGDRLVVASPYLATEVLATYGTNEGVLPIKGVLPEREERLADLAQVTRTGTMKRLAATRYGILLGSRAARELGAGEGDRIRVVSMTGDIYNVEVVGVYDLGIESANRSGIVNLRLAQAIERALPSEGSAIGLQLRDPDDAAAMAARIERVTGREVATWEELNPVTLDVLKRSRLLMLIVAVLIIVVAGLVVAHAIGSSASEERRDADALRSIGLSERGIRLTFGAQGLAIGIGGAGIGLLLGAIVVAIVAAVPAGAITSALHVEQQRIPMQWSVTAFVAPAAAAILSTLVGALVAARAVHR